MLKFRGIEQYRFCLVCFQLEFVFSHPVFYVRDAVLGSVPGVVIMFCTTRSAQLRVISKELVRTGVVEKYPQIKENQTVASYLFLKLSVSQ